MDVQVPDVLAWVWLALAGVSTVYVTASQLRNPQARVMKLGWTFTTLYMGPIGVLLYVLTDREPARGTHEQFIKPLWKQGVGSTVHCVAGDATGIIAAAAVTAALGMPMWQDLTVEYLAGFGFGLFVFQALFMQRLTGGIDRYLPALRRSLLPEWLSMNMMMAGMAPTMVFLMMGGDMWAMKPSESTFWFVMSLGVVVGFVLAYPVNVWMVARGLKHGLLTVRRPALAVAGDHGLPMRPLTARPERFAMAAVTVLTLLATLVWSASSADLSLSADDVGVTALAK